MKTTGNVYLEDGMEKIQLVKVCPVLYSFCIISVYSLTFSTLIPVVDCDQLPPVQNGTIDYSGFVFWETATYSCDIGFDLILNNQNSSVRVCTEEGIWSDDAPSCQSLYFSCCMF